MERDRKLANEAVHSSCMRWAPYMEPHSYPLCRKLFCLEIFSMLLGSFHISPLPLPDLLLPLLYIIDSTSGFTPPVSSCPLSPPPSLTLSVLRSSSPIYTPLLSTIYLRSYPNANTSSSPLPEAPQHECC